MHIREWVSTDALPRSTKPGRMQVMLEIGRQVQDGKGFATAPWFFQCRIFEGVERSVGIYRDWSNPEPTHFNEW